MTNYKLELCYDGTRYNGWQRLGDTDNTIQHKVEALLSRYLEQEIEVFSSGRTDAGVHARRQICSFHAQTDKSCSEILTALRTYLPSDIGAVSLKEAAERFHARYKCVGKTYIYRIWNSDEPNVFERKYMFPVPERLNLYEMRRAADMLKGEHDFTSFTAAKKMKKSAVREIYDIEITKKGNEVRLIFHGSGFLRAMVRILSGTLIEIGKGERSADDIPALIEAKDRVPAGFTAPACGLTLWDEEY